MLSPSLSETNGETIRSEPRVTTICRTAPIDGPYYPPPHHEYGISASSLHEVAPVESDREIVMAAVSVLSTVDLAKHFDPQNKKICQYLRSPTSAPHEFFRVPISSDNF